MTRRAAPLAVMLVVSVLLSACAPQSGGHPGRTRQPAAPRVDRGTLRTVSIPAVHSGFAARTTVVYVPAQARRSNAPLPVVMLLGGNPSTPRDWVADWHIAPFVDQFAAAHHGQAPIVVMPDENGTYRGDTECVDSSRGDAERYLTVDVPDYVRAHYRVRPARWAIAGVSEGGMCATVLALRHPTQFGAFANMSGLARPTIGERDREGLTVATLFDGSQQAFDSHDALWLLAHHRYPGLSGWLGAGRSDTDVVQAQTQLAAAAQRAGVPITRSAVPGAHGIGLWLRMLPAVFDWIWPRVQ